MSAACGLFLVDWIMRPFAKILEKMPLVMMLILFILYGFVAYAVCKSVYQEFREY